MTAHRFAARARTAARRAQACRAQRRRRPRRGRGTHLRPRNRSPRSANRDAYHPRRERDDQHERSESEHSPIDDEPLGRVDCSHRSQRHQRRCRDANATQGESRPRSRPRPDRRRGREQAVKHRGHVPPLIAASEDASCKCLRRQNDACTGDDRTENCERQCERSQSLCAWNALTSGVAEFDGATGAAA